MCADGTIASAATLTSAGRGSDLLARAAAKVAIVSRAPIAFCVSDHDMTRYDNPNMTPHANYNITEPGLYILQNGVLAHVVAGSEPPPHSGARLLRMQDDAIKGRVCARALPRPPAAPPAT